MLEIVMRCSVIWPSSLYKCIGGALRPIEGHCRIQCWLTFAKRMRLLLLVALPTSLSLLTSSTRCAFHPKWGWSTWLIATKLRLWVIKVCRRMYRFGPSFFTMWNYGHRLVLLIVVAHYWLNWRLTAHTRNMQGCLSRLSQFNTGAGFVIGFFLSWLGRWLSFILARAQRDLLN